MPRNLRRELLEETVGCLSNALLLYMICWCSFPGFGCLFVCFRLTGLMHIGCPIQRLCEEKIQVIYHKCGHLAPGIWHLASVWHLVVALLRNHISSSRRSIKSSLQPLHSQEELMSNSDGNRLCRAVSGSIILGRDCIAMCCRTIWESARHLMLQILLAWHDRGRGQRWKGFGWKMKRRQKIDDKQMAHI